MGNKKEILKELILAILNKTGPIPKVKLAKLILFAEIEHFKRTGNSITGLYFVRLKMGPAIAFFDEVLESGVGEMWNKKATPIFIHEENKEKIQYAYAPLISSHLSEDEVKKTLDETLQKYGKKSGTELSFLSHTLPAYRNSEPNDPIYVVELAIDDEAEYFALTDLVEDIDDDIDEEENAILAQKIFAHLP